MGVWDGVEWHDPIGRKVYVPEEATPCVVIINFDKGMPRELYFDRLGRAVVSIEVDGRRFVPARELDDCEVIE